MLPARYKPTGTAFDSGGMSDAVLCQDQHLERPVLVKILKPDTDQRRLLDEIGALQAIRSRHVVQIYDIIREGDGTIKAIVEEYIPGDDLTKSPIPASTQDFLRLAYQVAEGIADIHAHGRVHRDIKRQNMKYDAEGCLKIFDFGLARDTLTASTIGAWGTPGYMAPELFQVRPDGRTSFTPAVDTFAFGATVMALLRKALPDDLRAMPPRLPSKDVDFAGGPIALPAEISDILNRCLAPDPVVRPPMAEVAKVIETHLLQDRHRALITTQGQTHVLDKNKRTVRLSVDGQGSLTLSYTGFGFVVKSVEGRVAINNVQAKENSALPGSCVIVLGGNGGRHTNITVDVSHPEVGI